MGVFLLRQGHRKVVRGEYVLPALLVSALFGCLLAYYVLETEHGLISYKLLLVTLPVVNCQLSIIYCLCRFVWLLP